MGGYRNKSSDAFVKVQKSLDYFKLLSLNHLCSTLDNI